MIQKAVSLKRVINVTAKYYSNKVLNRVKNIGLDIVSNEYAFSCSAHGWNYLASIIDDYESGKGDLIHEYKIYKFFNHPEIKRIKYLNDILFLHDPSLHKSGDYKFYFGTYPWGCCWKDTKSIGGRPWGHQYDQDTGSNTSELWGKKTNIWYKPGGIEEIQYEWKKTIRLYNKIKKNGYKPFLRGDFPLVFFLINKKGEKRAIRFNGQHRLSILGYLKGHSSVRVIVPKESVEYIYEDNLDEWYYVKKGLCSKDLALRIFYAYFLLDGSERMEYLDLDNH